MLTHHSAAPCSALHTGLRCLQPAVQYIAGELAVHEGDVMPLVASHNTVSMRGLERVVCCCSRLFYLHQGELRVAFAWRALSALLHLVASATNTVIAWLQVRMKFDVESTDFLNLMRPDVAFPPHQFAMLADEGRCQVNARSGYPKMG